MKIVFLLERPSQFDAPLFRLAAADAEHEFEAWFTAQDPGGLQEDPELGRRIDWGEDLLEGYRSSILPARGQQRWFAERLAREPADLLIINGYTRRSYRAAARAGRAARTTTALRIDRVQFPGAATPRLARRLLIRSLVGIGFDRFLTTGSLGFDFLRCCGVPAQRIGRFPYAVDHERFAARSRLSEDERERARARWGIPNEARVVLSLTKFSEREAPWDMLAARQALRRDDLWWVLAGDGPKRDAFRAEAESSGLDRIVFPGYVDYGELPRAYGAVDLFVHPAREERWGVSVAEAAACRLPVVASDRVGAAFDLIEPGGNGERYRSGDGSALATAIERALSLDSAKAASVSTRRLEEFGLESTWRGLVSAAASWRRRSLG